MSSGSMANCGCEYVNLFTSGRLTSVKQVLARPCRPHAEQMEQHRAWLRPEVRYDAAGTAYVYEGVKRP